MFPEALIAPFVISAGIFLFRLMGSFMPAESCTRSKLLVAVSQCAGIVSFIGMGALRVMLQMRISEESFATSFFGTVEWAFVGMRADMLSKAGLPVERFRAALIST